MEQLKASITTGRPIEVQAGQGTTVRVVGTTVIASVSDCMLKEPQPATQTDTLKAELLRLLTEDPEVREATGNAALAAVMTSVRRGQLGAMIRDRSAPDSLAVARSVVAGITRDLRQARPGRSALDRSASS